MSSDFFWDHREVAELSELSIAHGFRSIWSFYGDPGGLETGNSYETARTKNHVFEPEVGLDRTHMVATVLV